MEYSPPPLFKQGASARVKVIFFTLLAIGLLVVDARLQTLDAVRQVVGTVLYPVQSAVLMPRDGVVGVAHYFSSLSRLQAENEKLKRQHLENAKLLMQTEQLLAENAQLRSILGAAERLPVASVMSEILYDARDAYSRKVVVNRGSHHGLAEGQPVIDDVGVVGQVTRTFLFTAEVTLLTDRNQAISVQVVRNGVRSIAYGSGQLGSLDLRFMSPNTDIQADDVLVTSGIDGVFPAGLPVARVKKVEHRTSDAFLRVICEPLAGVDRHKQLLVLITHSELAQNSTESEKGLKKLLQSRAPAEADASADTVIAQEPSQSDRAAQ
jgi:rod shape-determining protein MreC